MELLQQCLMEKIYMEIIIWSHSFQWWYMYISVENLLYKTLVLFHGAKQISCDENENLAKNHIHVLDSCGYVMILFYWYLHNIQLNV